MPKIKAVIFDMDGVLIDAKDWHYDALNRALSIFGETIQREEHLASFDGLPTRMKLKVLSKYGRLPLALHDFVNTLKQKHTMEIIALKCHPVFIHQYALSRLKRDGYKLALASNSVSNTVRMMMDLSRLSGYLDFSLSNEDVSKPKPDPEIYTTAIARLKSRPHEVLIVEDNEHGIEAAQAAGGHVMRIGSVEEVNYQNIRAHIQNVEAKIC